MGLQEWLNGILTITHMFHMPTEQELTDKFAFLAHEAEQEWGFLVFSRLLDCIPDI